MEKENGIEIIRHFLSIHEAENARISTIDSGLINSTFKVECSESTYILQKVNTDVFTDPRGIQENSVAIQNHLTRSDYPKETLSIVRNASGGLVYFDHSGRAWRLFEFIADSSHYEVIPSIDHAFEAAKALGEFHAYLSNFNASTLSTPIKGFLDFRERRNQYEQAFRAAESDRIKRASQEMEFIQQYAFILDEYQSIVPLLPDRVIHGDPKISNFLFKENSTEVIALIDWDTIMQGTFLYDFGDMVRSFTNRIEESDATRGAGFDEDIFEAIQEGYLFHQKDQLAPIEYENLTLGTKAVIYIQALRFLTDYLNGDIYYKTKYAGQNLDRSSNQIRLLKGFMNRSIS